MSAEDWTRAILQSPVVAAVVVGVFSIFTVFLPLSRFRSERWWERKAAAYTEIIECLHTLTEYYAAAILSEENHFKENLERHVKMFEEQKTAREKLRKAANIGAFVITKRAAYTLLDLLHHLDAIKAGSMLEHFKQGQALVDQAIIDLKVEARDDLKTR